MASRLGSLPWSTGVEDAFRALAAELEREESNLDPEPYVSASGRRHAPEELVFIGRGKVRFDPREGYESEESEYVRG